MASLVSLGPGDIFAGEYRVERPLAEGGMGAVYVAEQISTGKRRALKVMHPQLVPDEKSRQRFVEEARVGSRIESEHVVEVVAAGVDGPTGVPWLAMELLEGADLDRLVEQEGPLSALATLAMLEQACHALALAHARGIIHRDLKPENLFVARSRRMTGEQVVKILDFGIARTVEESRNAATVTSAIGSPLWMAPEQAQPGARLQPATDVWALGLITFFLMTGRSYWRAANHPQFTLQALLVEIMTLPIEPPSARAAELGVGSPFPAGFDEWFARCVDRSIDARFPDAGAAIEALRPVLRGGVPASGRQVAPTVAMPAYVSQKTALAPDAPPMAPSQRGRAPLWAMGALVVVVGGAGLSWVALGGEPAPSPTTDPQVTAEPADVPELTATEEPLDESPAEVPGVNEEAPPPVEPEPVPIEAPSPSRPRRTTREPAPSVEPDPPRTPPEPPPVTPEPPRTEPEPPRPEPPRTDPEPPRTEPEPGERPGSRWRRWREPGQGDPGVRDPALRDPDERERRFRELVRDRLERENRSEPVAP